MQESDARTRDLRTISNEELAALMQPEQLSFYWDAPEVPRLLEPEPAPKLELHEKELDVFCHCCGQHASFHTINERYDGAELYTQCCGREETRKFTSEQYRAVRKEGKWVAFLCQ